MRPRRDRDRDLRVRPAESRKTWAQGARGGGTTSARGTREADAGAVRLAGRRRGHVPGAVRVAADTAWAGRLNRPEKATLRQEEHVP